MKLKISLSLGFLILTAGLILIVVFWLNYPYQPLTIMCEQRGKSGEVLYDDRGEALLEECPGVENAFKVNPDTVVSGETMTTVIHYCKNSQGLELVSRDLVGETIIINVPPKELAVQTPVGCATSESIVRVPRTINPGTYYLQYTVTYKVNPLRHVTLTFSSEPFTIVAAPIAR